MLGSWCTFCSLQKKTDLHEMHKGVDVIIHCLYAFSCKLGHTKEANHWAVILRVPFVGERSVQSSGSWHYPISWLLTIVGKAAQQHSSPFTITPTHKAQCPLHCCLSIQQLNHCFLPVFKQDLGQFCSAGLLLCPQPHTYTHTHTHICCFDPGVPGR